MTQEKIVERFALMAAPEWKSLAMQTTWYFRTKGAKPIPGKILAAFKDEAPTHETWLAVCKAVAAKRRSLRYIARKEVLTCRKVARRVYMKGYMKDYRQRKKANHAGPRP